jgi:hypothetical protein
LLDAAPRQLGGAPLACRPSSSGLDKADQLGAANMPQFGSRKEGAVSSEFLRISPIADPGAVTVASNETLRFGQVAQFVLRAPEGSIVALGGINGAVLRELIDRTEPDEKNRRVLCFPLRLLANVEAYVEQVIELLADAARRLWPVWFTDVSFAMCRDDALGRQAAGVIASEVATRVPSASVTWARSATRLALAGRPPRVAGVLPAIRLHARRRSSRT